MTGSPLVPLLASQLAGIANERTHYTVPGSGDDVILFRSHAGTLAASVRRADWKNQADWSAVVRCLWLGSERGRGDGEEEEEEEDGVLFRFALGSVNYEEGAI